MYVPICMISLLSTYPPTQKRKKKNVFIHFNLDIASPGVHPTLLNRIYGEPTNVSNRRLVRNRQTLFFRIVFFYLNSIYRFAYTQPELLPHALEQPQDERPRPAAYGLENRHPRNPHIAGKCSSNKKCICVTAVRTLSSF